MLKNKKWSKGLLSVLAAASMAIGLTASSYALDLDQVRNAIVEQKAPWTAGESEISAMPDNEFKQLLGFYPDNYNFKLPVLESSNKAVPSAIDWRDNGGNFVTPVKDQAKCGSCWAFATTGVMESYLLRKNGTPGLDVDMSEQAMLSCSNAGNCQQGGQLGKAADWLMNAGTRPERFAPYTATDQACNTLPGGWEAEVQKIESWKYASFLPDLLQLKDAVANYGPIAVGYQVFEDFKNYTSGIYKYTTGKKLGGHGVVIVGYKDDFSAPGGGYFIVKNSWKPTWGENGYFRIGYSEVYSQVQFGLSAIAYTK